MNNDAMATHAAAGEQAERIGADVSAAMVQPANADDGAAMVLAKAADDVAANDAEVKSELDTPSIGVRCVRFSTGRPVRRGVPRR